MTRAPRIACIGEVMIELAPATPELMRLGVAGDTYNTAVYLARRIGPGAVAYVTALGDDAQSDHIIAALTAEGIAPDLVERVPDAVPGLYMITLDPRGERSFSYWRSHSAARGLFSRPGGLRPQRLNGMEMIYLSAISLAVITPEARGRLFDWAQGYRRAGGRIAFDSNYRARLWPDVETARHEVARFWSVTDIALPSLDDEQALFGAATEAQVIRRLHEAGVRGGALKRGAAGPVALDGSVLTLAPQPEIPVIDTTAAGDSFNAGFLAALLAGETTAAAMAAGHSLAARVIGHRGAIMPRQTDQPA